MLSKKKMVSSTAQHADLEKKNDVTQKNPVPRGLGRVL